MASQLREVLNHFTDQTAPVSVRSMARDMNLEVGVLNEMIEYWVRKGKLREVNSTGQTCTTCGVKSACPFIVNLPRYYERVTDEHTPSDAPCGCGGSCSV